MNIIEGSLTRIALVSNKPHVDLLKLCDLVKILNSYFSGSYKL